MSRKFWTRARTLVALGLLAITQIAVAGDYPEIVAGCCPAGSCRKVCRPTVESKKVSTRVYDSACEDFCLPKCSLFGGLFGHKGCRGDGADSACAKCEHPRMRKYLVVKIRHHEECENKCVVDREVCPVVMPCLQPGAEAPAPASKSLGQAGSEPMPVLINR